MRLALAAATSALAHAGLAPYNMTKVICDAPGDLVDNTACYQHVFDKLVEAEVTAVAASRRAQLDADASAATVASTANALAWAYQNVVTTLEKHGVKWKW